MLADVLTLDTRSRRWASDRPVKQDSRRISRHRTYCRRRCRSFLHYGILHDPSESGQLQRHHVIHAMSANLIFILIPFTKLDHITCFRHQLVSAGRHFPATRDDVAIALKKENGDMNR
jgi:hypothetical protein